VFLRTGVHPSVAWLKEQGCVFSTFDYLYQDLPSFRDVYEAICRKVLVAAQEGPVVYGVPGHPLVYEESVRLILVGAKEAGVSVQVLPAMSFLDAVLVSLGLSAEKGLQVLDGLSLDEQFPMTTGPVVVTQVHSKLVAADVKLSLLEHYPAEHPITVVQAAGVPGLERIEIVPLRKLDRLDWLDHLTSLYLPEELEGSKGLLAMGECAQGSSLDRLTGLMARLRGPKGCPWDLEQSHLTLRTYLLEEAYEVLEALNEEDMHKLCEELGDLLLQVVFHAQIARESGAFELEDVICGINEKIIRRHPHVFGQVTAKDSAEVNRNWERIKAQERKDVVSQHLLDGVSRNMPGLMRAVKLQKKAALVGFDWPDHRGAVEKFYEELEELLQALSDGDKKQIERETGEWLFSVANLALIIKVDPEIAIIMTCEKFVKRFGFVEDKAWEKGYALKDCSLQQLDDWWEEAKKQEKG
jgi:tetrapyrrole methylase family protein/MazG family protein